MEVQATVSKMFSTFHRAMDALETIQDPRGRKKRKEKDVEELIEGRLLHKSLAEGRYLCQKAVSNRHQQNGMAFDVGGAPATSALKDAVISLRGDVLRALHMWLVSKTTSIDIRQPIELSITNRQSAIRAMDELRQRLAGIAAQSQSTYIEEKHDGQPSPYISQVSPGMGSIHPQMYRTRSHESVESLPMAIAASTCQDA